MNSRKSSYFFTSDAESTCAHTRPLRRSNKLDGVFEVTDRDFQWDPLTAHNGGRVTEMLSEHTLQGWMQGYTLTGRHGLFPSYEAFLGIVATMMVQYSKFLRMGLETSWRSDVAALTYIETSTWTRQEHNGYSHQNVSLSTLLVLGSKGANLIVLDSLVSLELFSPFLPTSLVSTSPPMPTLQFRSSNTALVQRTSMS